MNTNISTSTFTPTSATSAPRRTSSFDDLPAELLLYIYSYLGLRSYLQLTLAIYPTLHRHGLVPALTVPTFIRLTRAAQRTPRSTPHALAQLPAELWLQIADLGDSTDNVSLVFALSGQVWRVQERVEDPTRMRLWVWSRRSGECEESEARGC